MNNILAKFNEEYQKLSEKEIEKFQVLVNKLINFNYLTANKDEDKSDYYFIVSHFDCFSSYFILGGRHLELYKLQRTLVLSSEYSLKLSLNKINSIILLILRLLYHQKIHDISLENKVIISIGDIQEKCEQLLISSSERFKITELTESLRVFKKYNIINFKGNDFQKDDTLIEIYPTIQYAVGINDINDIIEKIKTYKEKSEENEEIDEDKIN